MPSLFKEKKIKIKNQLLTLHNLLEKGEPDSVLIYHLEDALETVFQLFYLEEDPMPTSPKLPTEHFLETGNQLMFKAVHREEAGVSSMELMQVSAMFYIAASLAEIANKLKEKDDPIIPATRETPEVQVDGAK